MLPLLLEFDACTGTFNIKVNKCGGFAPDFAIRLILLINR
jgi:hypothetical protein